MNIGKQVKKRREELGLTQDDVGHGCGIHSTTVSKIEREVYEPKPEIMVKVCCYVGVYDPRYNPRKMCLYLIEHPEAEKKNQPQPEQVQMVEVQTGINSEIKNELTRIRELLEILVQQPEHING